MSDLISNLRAFLQQYDEMSRDEMNEAIDAIKSHYHRHNLITSGPCLHCKKSINYGRPSPTHKQRGDEWLLSVREKWRTPPIVEPHNARAFYDPKSDRWSINGYKRPNVMPYFCTDCAEEIDALIVEAFEQYKARQNRAAVDTSKRDMQIIRGEIRATPAKRYWTLCRYITEQDTENLATMPYKDFLNSHYWSIVRGYIRYKRGERCELCNGGPSGLHVHHKTYEHRGSEYENLNDLILLCAHCHAKFHDKLASE